MSFIKIKKKIHVIIRWDRELDDNSDSPKKQTFEKMTSKMYLGDLFYFYFFSWESIVIFIFYFF